MPPLNRLMDLQEQIKPAFEEVKWIGGQIPTVAALERDRIAPSSQQSRTQTIQELIRRGTANLFRLRRVTTPDTGLIPMVDVLIQAQSDQLARLQAAQRYLETGGDEDLSGPNGVGMGRTATIEALRAFQDQQRRYLSEHAAIIDQGKPEL